MRAVKESGVQRRLLDLLEYRVIIGAIVTTPDGLLVASTAVEFEDAELMAATTAAREEREGFDPSYWVASSRFGSMRVVNGEDMRLIALTEPETAEKHIRPIMTGHISSLEETIRF